MKSKNTFHKTVLGTLLSLFTVILASYSIGQSEFYYYSNGEKIHLDLNTKSLNISVFQNFKKDNLGDFKLLGYSLDEDRSQNKTSDLMYATIEFESKSTNVDYFATIESLKNTAGVRTVYPSFLGDNGTEIGLSDYIYIKLKNDADYSLMEAQALEYDLTIVEQNKFMPLWYTLRCSKNTDFSSLEVANRIFETGQFSSSVADLMTNHNIACTDDPEFDNLWGLSGSSTQDAGINACDAWAISEGSGVKVAVLDRGIELTHIDLAGNIDPLSYDTESGSSPSVISAGGGNDHGTHVAGIIGAIKDNNLQVVGVAPQSTLMSISNLLAATPNSKMKLADGINWAVLNDADIINNSWNSYVHYDIIDDAIDNALENGRNGLGCVMVFSSGNDAITSTPVLYPANYHPDILAVGSTFQAGQRSSFSNFGPELDVVAPGWQIISTELLNTIGSKNGTSMATPHVAGLAALILSVKPCLTAVQVNYIIEHTAQKTGPIAYTNSPLDRPNGTWNDEMGYGLIDAHAAVLLAQTFSCGDPCNSTISSFPYTESFENDLGNWEQSTDDDFDWTRLSGATPTSNTGPSMADDGMYYAYVESSAPNNPSKSAILTSPCFNLTGQNGTILNFAYHMHGLTMGTLDLQVTSNGGLVWTSIWDDMVNHGDQWITATVDLSAFSGSTIQMRFVGTTANGENSDIAIDDISIQEIYPCLTTITSFPYSETFQSGMGEWKQPSLDDFNWTRKTGSTPTSLTGPSSAFFGSHYVYTEASSNTPDKVAFLNSPCFDLTGQNGTGLRFAYHMYGTSMGTLDLQVSLDDGFSWISEWDLTGDQGNDWHIADVDLSAYSGSTIQLRFVGTTANGELGDMAIDAIQVSEIAPCNSNITAFPYSESFETDFGDWTQPSSDDFDWTRTLGSTPTEFTGPSSAHDGLNYAYIESDSPNIPFKSAELVSPCFDLTNEINTVLSFAYHMNGSSLGSLELEVSDDGGYTWTSEWSEDDDMGVDWIEERVDLSNYDGSVIQLRFTGMTSNGSEGDIAIDDITITELLPCNTFVFSFPYNESFETGLGDWEQTTNDDFDWTRLMGATPTSGTGPTTAFDGSYYMYVEASSPNIPSKTTILLSPCILLEQEPMSVSFAYHMNGADIGSLQLEISDNSGISWNHLWTGNQSKGDAWFTKSVDLSAYAGSSIRLRFVGTTSANEFGDMAIDNIAIESKSCNTVISSLPYSESFESDFGDWEQAADDHFDWSRTTGTTPTQGTGPMAADHGMYYAYIESSSPNNFYKTAKLVSPCFDLTNQNYVGLNFAYHMYGSSVGLLQLEISLDEGSTWTQIWSRSGAQSKYWKTGFVNLNAYVGNTVRLRFTGVTTLGESGDIAIDDLFMSYYQSPNKIQEDVVVNDATLNSPEVHIYPNPAQEFAIVDFSSLDSDEISVSVFDMIGKSVYSASTIEGETTTHLMVPTKELSSGTYMVIVEDNAGNRYNKKMLVK